VAVLHWNMNINQNGRSTTVSLNSVQSLINY